MSVRRKRQLNSRNTRERCIARPLGAKSSLSNVEVSSNDGFALSDDEQYMAEKFILACTVLELRVKDTIKTQ